MIKMMLTVVLIYTVSWLPFNLFLVYGDIWDENLYLENREIVSYIYPIIHWLAMSHSVWNPIVYCWMHARFREGFKSAISNVPCIWKLARFCQLYKSRRSRSGITTDSGRRRMSYYSHSGNTRLFRTNTTTTYTFGSGSLHNIHNTGIHYHHQHHNYAMNNPLMMRKQSYLLASNGNGSLNGRDHLHTRSGSRPSLTSSSILVSQYPKPTHLNILGCSAPSASMGGISGVRAHDILLSSSRDGLKQSSTMTSLAPGPSSSLESSPSSPGRTSDNFVAAPAVAMSCLKQQQSSVKGNGFDLNNSCTNGCSSCNKMTNGKKKVSLKKKATSNGNGVANSSSYVTISSNKGGKEQVVTTTTLAGKKGKSISTSSTSSTPSSTTSNGAGSRSFLSRKRSSNSSGVSESFM